MPKPVIVAGTGTDVGKTVFSGLVMARYAAELGLKYWKPVQSGSPTDTETVRRISNLGTEFFLPEVHHFALPASPHRAAEVEGKKIDFDALVLNLRTQNASRVLIELAGGLMVPLSRPSAGWADRPDRYKTNLDLTQALGYPVILVAATGLGTINHTVMSLRMLKECAGVFFVGPDNPLFEDNVRTIQEMTGVRILGHYFPDGQISSSGFDPEKKVRDLLT